MSQIKSSVNNLLDIKAILPQSTLPLTPLGYHLAKMPVDVRIGKMLIMSCLLQCLEPALTAAAALAGRSPFFYPPNAREDAYKAHSYFTSSENYKYLRKKYGLPDNGMIIGNCNEKDQDKDCLTPKNDFFFSDHLAMINAYDLWCDIQLNKGKQISYQFCKDMYLSSSSLEEIRKLRESFRSYLMDVGFVTHRRKIVAMDGDDDGDGDSSNSENGDDDGDGNDDENNTSKPKGSALVLVDNKRDDISESICGPSFKYDAMRCVLFAGLYPQVSKVCYREMDSKVRSKKGGNDHKRNPKVIKILQDDGMEVNIHPSSHTHKYVKYLLEGGGQGSGQGVKSTIRIKDAYIVYHKKVASSSKIFLYDCTSIPASAVLLFGGDILISKPPKGSKRKPMNNNLNSDPSGRVLVTVGGWIQFEMSELHAVLFKRLQLEIDMLLQMKVQNPMIDVSKQQNVLITVLHSLLQ